MATINVDDSLNFHFDPNVSAWAYDSSSHYEKAKKQKQGLKAVDIVAAEKTRLQPNNCWLVEVKDFRRRRGEPKPKNDAINLPETVRGKVADTLSELPLVKGVETAELACRSESVRVVLHLETGPKSKLFPNQPNPANMRQKLKQLLRDIDPNPLVLSINTTPKAGVPWSVS